MKRRKVPSGDIVPAHRINEMGIAEKNIHEFLCVVTLGLWIPVYLKTRKKRKSWGIYS